MMRGVGCSSGDDDALAIVLPREAVAEPSFTACSPRESRLSPPAHDGVRLVFSNTNLQTTFSFLRIVSPNGSLPFLRASPFPNKNNRSPVLHSPPLRHTQMRCWYDPAFVMYRTHLIV